MRALIAWIAPAVATYAAWWMFLGFDSDDVYTVAQVAGLVIVLIAIGVACGWYARGTDLLPMIVASVVGISAACWASWSDDITGLFGVGWVMVTAGSACAATAVIVVTYTMRDVVRERYGRPPA